jgi:putative pyruvate formate lyase activating enzyme
MLKIDVPDNKSFDNIQDTEIDRSLTVEDIELLQNCNICPRKCGVNRFIQNGVCKVGAKLKIASFNLHYGEEPPISGIKGSGTIFFSGCNLACVYCQNYPISQLANGGEYSINDLVNEMLVLQSRGVHNINLVTPSHYIVQIRRSLILAKEKGLKIPIVYNTSGYDSLRALQMLDGLIDIYMPDIRYQSNPMSQKYSNCPNYEIVNKQALIEMFRQVGTLEMDEQGIARKGLLIRHLVLPENIAETEKALSFIANELSTDTYISLMSQYFPAFKANSFPELSRKLYPAEYELALALLEEYRLENGWTQDIG